MVVVVMLVVVVMIVKRGKKDRNSKCQRNDDRKNEYGENGMGMKGSMNGEWRRSNIKRLFERCGEKKKSMNTNRF